MKEKDVKELLSKYKNNLMTEDQVIDSLKEFLVTKQLDFMVQDVHREKRIGVPEVIFAEKKPDEVLLQALNLIKAKNIILFSRLLPAQFELLLKKLDGYKDVEHEWDPIARTLAVYKKNWKPKKISRKVAILTAGSSDLPIASETRFLLKYMGIETISFHDVGVAGIHRLKEPLKEIIKRDKEIDVVIVFAGMDGALPSVVAGVLNLPVIGVPTSVGYGAGKEGISALLAMLQSCSPGIAVVNIDGGYNAAVMAATICNHVEKVLETIQKHPRLQDR